VFDLKFTALAKTLLKRQETASAPEAVVCTDNNKVAEVEEFI